VNRNLLLVRHTEMRSKEVKNYVQVINLELLNRLKRDRMRSC